MKFVRWLDDRHGKKKTKKGRKGKERDFLKLHFILDCTSILILSSFKVTNLLDFGRILKFEHD
jgi:hypothetical protein